MIVDQRVVMFGVGALSLVAVCGLLAAAWFAGRRSAEILTPAANRTGLPWSEEPPSDTEGELDAPRRSVRDRVIRVSALLFLAAVALVTALTDLWRQDAGAIYVLVGLGVLAVVVFEDALPGLVAPGVRTAVEAGGAVVFLALLTWLSGGIASPFNVGFFLLVAAAALSRRELAPIVLAVVAGLVVMAVHLLHGVAYDQLDVMDVASIFALALGLQLVAAIGAITAREQRRVRDNALRLARYDPLTGLYNRAHFFAEMDREIRLSQRATRTFALLMIDLDGLKPVNDRFGHHYGDRLLQAVSGVVRRTVRSTDTPARYGGDEFVVLLPETDAPGAFVVAEKLRKDIAAFTIQVSDQTIRSTVSIGLVTYPEDGDTVDGLMAASDAALYEAKRAGRDRIVGYTTRTERVATPMGNGEGRPATPQAAEAPPEPPQAEAAPPEPPRAQVHGSAPWETGTNGG